MEKAPLHEGLDFAPCFHPVFVQPLETLPVVVEQCADDVVLLVHQESFKFNGRRIAMQLVVLLRRDGNDDVGIADLRGVVQSPQQVMSNLTFPAKCGGEARQNQPLHVPLEIQNSLTVGSHIPSLHKIRTVGLQETLTVLYFTQHDCRRHNL